MGYEVTVVGAGPEGIFAALTLAELGIGPVLLLEQGRDLERRSHEALEGLKSSFPGTITLECQGSEWSAAKLGLIPCTGVSMNQNEQITRSVLWLWVGRAMGMSRGR